MKALHLTLALAIGALTFTACGSEKEEEEIKPQKPIYDGSVGVTACPDENHPHAIDLGLPSGTKWSCCNLGAKTPEGFGLYYAWGATKTYKTYGWASYEYYKIDKGGDVTYTPLPNDISGTEYDAAHLYWQGKWQMPTEAQAEELKDNCNRLWEPGVGAYMESKINHARILMPAASYYSETGLNSAFGRASFWTSNMYPGDEEHPNFLDDALHFDITNQKVECNLHNRRCWGLTIRPVAGN